ncbi:MAG TPA: xanthine dehydrogenase family protein subunit M [Chloroflexota bacterium]|nr:xanthine dehydrogenase family protein subunit M [Chloroflexota bacterium]
MGPAVFDYVAATSVAEAVKFLADHRGEAKVVAGGHSLIPLMKLRLASPAYLVDIGRIPGLAGISESNGTVRIGALATHHDVEESPIIRERVPVLAEAAAQIGDLQVRNKGTIGGSLAHADPAADYPAALLALDAEISATGSKGQRTLKVSDLFINLLTTALNPDEIITEVRVPALTGRTGSSYQKFPHPASRYAVVGVAAVIEISTSGNVERAAIGVTGAGAIPVRASVAEAALTGKAIDDVALGQAGDRAAEAIKDPLSDLHASAEYRRHLVRELAIRAIRVAAQRAMDM